MVSLPLRKKENYEQAKENAFIDKNPKMLLDRLKEFEQNFGNKDKREREKSKVELEHQNELFDSPILSELEEQHRKGLISSKSYEEVLNAFRTLKTPKILVRKEEGMSTKTLEPEKEAGSVKEPESEEKEEETPVKEEKATPKKEPAKKKNEIDETYTGLGPLNALRKYLFNVYKK